MLLALWERGRPLWESVRPFWERSRPFWERSRPRLPLGARTSRPQ